MQIPTQPLHSVSSSTSCVDIEQVKADPRVSNGKQFMA
jgi:hypothetical protein